MSRYLVPGCALLFGLTIAESQALATDRLVPGAFGNIQLAINAATPGTDDVVVSNNGGGNTPYGPIVMRNLVDVKIAASQTPIISGIGGNRAVTFPSSVTNSTSITGMMIMGGDTTVVMEGDGRLIDCSIASAGDNTKVGIFQTGNNTGNSDNLSLLLEGTGEASIGLYVEAGNIHVTDSSIIVRADDGSYGVYVASHKPGSPNPSGIALTNTLVKAPNGTGVYFNISGSTVLRGIVEHCTIDSVKYQAVRFKDISGGGGGVRRTIATHSATGDTLIRGIKGLVDSCITYPTGISVASLTGSGNVVQDPLYCDPDLGAYTLRIDSYGSIEQNPSHGLRGAFPVACAWGTLARDTKVTANSNIAVTSDVVVPNGKNLVIGAGATFNVDNTYSISVSGRMQAVGTNASKITFRSSEVSPAPGDWYGIEATGKLLIDYAQVMHAQYGIVPSGSDTSKVEHSILANNSFDDILVGGSPNPLLISRNVISTIGTGINLACADFSNATVSNNKITAVNSSSVAGIKVDGFGTPTGSITAVADTVTDFDGGAAVLIMDSTPTFTNCRLVDNKYGVHIQGGAPLIGTTSSSSDNTILTNTRGIYVQGPSAVTCNPCTTICPVIRNNLIDSNTYGVVTEKTTSVDLGYDASHKGLNSILNSGTYCIWNRAHSSCGSVLSYGDYYGGGGAPSCSDGLVTISSWETTQPASARGEIQLEPTLPGATRPLQLMGIRPNPIAASTTVSFAVSGVSNRVNVAVFDVSGRLVRNLASGSYSAGSYEVPWDGTNLNGSAVPEGMYFVRLTGDNGFRQTSKIMVLR